MSKTFITTVQEDPEDPSQCILIIPPEVLEELGWKEGTELDISYNETDNTIILQETNKPHKTV